MKWITATPFALYRICLGTYLTIHFARLLPVATELFSNQGVIDDVSVLPSFGKLPVFLFTYDNPFVVHLFIWSLVICSILFTIGFHRHICSAWLYYGWMSLLNRNPLISNPSLGYIGWILLSCICIPKGERLGFLLSEEQRMKESTRKRWQVPDVLYYGMWIIVGVSYTASGFHKLQCPSWIDGTALYYVLTGPLVRQNFVVDILVSNMFLIKIMTWSSLFLEISALFLGTFYRTRKYYWVMFMMFHFGILTTINFGDLTFGMIMAHLYTFDPSWFSFTRKLVEKYDYNNQRIFEFDINLSDKFNSKKMREHFVETVKSLSHTSETVSNESSHNMDSSETVSNESGHNMGLWVISAVGIFVMALLVNSANDTMASINRFTEMTVDMYWGFGVLVVILGILMILERIYPDQKLEYVEGWWKWVLIINVFQLFAVIIAAFTWEEWLQNTNYFKNSTSFHLRDHVSPFVGGLIAYFINQWLFYHWHKARHEVYFLWILFHQFHHSPSRIEAITSFYKHPFEIMVDSQIMAILLYSVLGLDKDSSLWLSIFSGIGEYIYHMNIKTPKIMGYFFQRPESHRCHHRRNKRIHCPNYSDLPIMDILGGTFENPERMDDPTGFSPDRETRRIDMLFLKDVLFGNHQDIFSDRRKLKKVIIRYLTYALVIWGTLNASSFIAHQEKLRDIGFVTVSSPLPLVFSAYNGVETFATGFNITINYTNGTQYVTSLDAEKYGQLAGAYNRRNIYGAIFSHGPFFDKTNLIKIRQNILEYAVCKPGTIINDFGLQGIINDMHVDVFDRPRGNHKIGSLDINCR